MELTVPMYASITSPDCAPRRGGQAWTGIVIHHTGTGRSSGIHKDSTWKSLFKNIALWLSKKDSHYVSSHYLIGRNGELAMLVDPDSHIAWHAGRSAWWHPVDRVWKKGCNGFMIGIELVGDGNVQAYSDSQYKALSALVRDLRGRYSTVGAHCVVGHEMTSPGRKVDPGRLFDWKRFYTMCFT